MEAEVGPIKYIAALLYDDVDSNILDKSVRFVIILLVLVFDPMAVLLVIAGNFSLREIARAKEEKSGGYEVNIPSKKVDVTTVGPIPMDKNEIVSAREMYHRDQDSM